MKKGISDFLKYSFSGIFEISFHANEKKPRIKLIRTSTGSGIEYLVQFYTIKSSENWPDRNFKVKLPDIRSNTKVINKSNGINNIIDLIIQYIKQQTHDLGMTIRMMISQYMTPFLT